MFWRLAPFAIRRPVMYSPGWYRETDRLRESWTSIFHACFAGTFCSSEKTTSKGEFEALSHWNYNRCAFLEWGRAVASLQCELAASRAIPTTSLQSGIGPLAWLHTTCCPGDQCRIRRANSRHQDTFACCRDGRAAWKPCTDWSFQRMFAAMRHLSSPGDCEGSAVGLRSARNNRVKRSYAEWTIHSVKWR